MEAFLREFARGVQKFGLYPDGHPAREATAREVSRALQPVLRIRGGLELGVAPDCLLYAGRPADPENPALRSLAGRLHAHELSRVGFRPGVTSDELAAFLAAVGVRPETDADRLGMRRPPRGGHVVLDSPHYERLALADREKQGDAATEREVTEAGRRAARLWMGLARAALLLDGEAKDGEEAPEAASFDPVVIARSIESLSADEMRSRALATRMLDVVRALEKRDDDGGFGLRERFSRLLESLERGTLSRLLRENASEAERRDFLLAGCPWIPVDAAVELVEDASRAGELDVSAWLLRLLLKLARYTDSDSALATPEAERAVREQIDRLLTEWRPEAVEPGAYEEGLRRLSERRRGAAGGRGGEERPGGELPRPTAVRLVQTALEADELGPTGEAAVESLLTGDGMGELTRLLETPPEGSRVAEELWERLSTPELVARLLARDPIDFPVLRAVALRVGPRAADLLLDELSESESRSERGKLFSLLAEMGPGVGEAAHLRLRADDRWYVLRNMLALLAELPDRPADFDPRLWTRHEHPAVRREAFKHLLEDEAPEAEILRGALEQDDPRTVGLALSAAALHPPGPDLVPLLARHTADERLDPRIRSQGVRALEATGGEAARRALTELCLKRHRWFFWRRRLADSSPPVVEAVAALARTWSEHAGTRRTLELARASGSSRLRKAAAAAGPGGVSSGSLPEGGE